MKERKDREQGGEIERKGEREQHLHEAQILIVN